MTNLKLVSEGNLFSALAFDEDYSTTLKSVLRAIVPTFLSASGSVMINVKA
jgi:hypothetical protein